MLKNAGIKGYSKLNKAGLERLLESGSVSSDEPHPKTAKKPRKPRVAKPKPFTPAEVRGDTPVVAETQIPRIVFPNKPPTLKQSNKSKMQSFFGGFNLPSPRALPAPSMMLNMGKLIEGRSANDAPFSSPRGDKPPSMRKSFLPKMLTPRTPKTARAQVTPRGASSRSGLVTQYV